MLLLCLLLLPTVGAALVFVVPARLDRAGRAAATVVAGLVLLVAAGLWLWRDPGGGLLGSAPLSSGPLPAPIWHELDLAWVPALHLRFHLVLDVISYPLVVLTALLTLLCCGYTWWRTPTAAGEARPAGGARLAALLLLIEVGVLGTFLAGDLALFFLSFEIVLLPMYAVIVGWGGADRTRAGRLFALYTLLGSVLLLVGVFVVVNAAGTADIAALTGGVGLSRGVQFTAFALFALAFAVKAPLWPLHSWLPAAHTQAPTVGSVLLAGVLLKMGTYGLIRIGVGVTPLGLHAAAPILGAFAVAAIIVGSLVCLAQSELKRLIAYSSVGHMGFVLLGIATGTPMGLRAALIGNIAHGLITGLLFFLVGEVKDRTGTGELAALGGLRERAPALAGVLGFAAIASLGLPGLAGFWGEAFAVVAAVEVGGGFWITLAVLAALGGALTAAYFLRLLRVVSHGEPSSAVLGMAGSSTAVSWWTWAPLVALTVAVGVVPVLALAPVGEIGPALSRLTEGLR